MSGNSLGTSPPPGGKQFRVVPEERGQDGTVASISARNNRVP